METRFDLLLRRLSKKSQRVKLTRIRGTTQRLPSGRSRQKTGQCWKGLWRACSSASRARMWTVCAGVDTRLHTFGGLVCVPARAPLHAASLRFRQLPPRRLSAQSDSGRRRRHRQAGGRNVGLERRDQAQEFVVEEVGARRPGPADHAGARQSRRAHGACCGPHGAKLKRLCVLRTECHFSVQVCARAHMSCNCSSIYAYTARHSLEEPPQPASRCHNHGALCRGVPPARASAVGRGTASARSRGQACSHRRTRRAGA